MELIRQAQGQEEMAGFCENGNKMSGSIKRSEFLDWLRTCQLLNHVLRGISTRFNSRYTT